MFLHVSVCPRGEGMCCGGACVVGGMHGEGHVWQGAGGHAWQGGMCGNVECMAGGMHRRRACMVGGFAWQGACMAGVHDKGACMAGGTHAPPEDTTRYHQ